MYQKINEKKKLSNWGSGVLWLLMSGPLVVIVAAFFTAYLAFVTKEKVLTEADFKNPVTGAEIRSLVPAQSASFHAATPDSSMPEIQSIAKPKKNNISDTPIPAGTKP